MADMNNKEEGNHAVLTITGSDGTGGAGIQADIRTITALGGTPLSAITTVTVQNTLGIQEFYDLPLQVLEQQLGAIIDDVRPAAVKIGMLRNRGQLQVVVRMLRKYSLPWVVYDPVELTTRGERLVDESLKQEIRQELLPLCSVVTSQLRVESLVDWDKHGVRGVFSTAIATCLALGKTKDEAISEAMAYVNRQAAMAGHLEGRGARLYNELLSLIASHCREHSDVQFYAERMNVSSHYLAQVTRRMAAVSPKQLIDEYLLKEVKVALRSKDLTIQEVAYRYGFTSQSHFTKFFRKLTGETPTAYRKSSL